MSRAHLASFCIICCAVSLSLNAVYSVAHPLAAISAQEQMQLAGSGGTDTQCTGSATCTACTPPSGCAAAPVFAGFTLTGYCSCTAAGMQGCTAGGGFSVCAPTPNASCTVAGGTNACGTYDAPTVPVIGWTGTAWLCATVGTCTTGSAGSPYCTNCL